MSAMAVATRSLQDFHLFLPQDDWLAGGSGRGKGHETSWALSGANEAESQAAFDDNMAQLKALLALPPRQFWKEGDAMILIV